MVLSLAWRWIFKSKHLALTYAFIIQLCWLKCVYIYIYIYNNNNNNKVNTGLFEIIVGVLTTCHTQYTSDSSICINKVNIWRLKLKPSHNQFSLYKLIYFSCCNWNLWTFGIPRCRKTKQLLDLFSWRAWEWPTRSKHGALTYIPLYIK